MEFSEEKNVIYLDYNATTNIHEEVRKAMVIHQVLINMEFKLKKVYLKQDNKYQKC